MFKCQIRCLNRHGLTVEERKCRNTWDVLQERSQQISTFPAETSDLRCCLSTTIFISFLQIHHFIILYIIVMSNLFVFLLVCLFCFTLPLRTYFYRCKQNGRGRTRSREGLQMFCFLLCLFPKLFGSDPNTSAPSSLSAFVSDSPRQILSWLQIIHTHSQTLSTKHDISEHRLERVILHSGNSC